MFNKLFQKCNSNLRQNLVTRCIYNKTEIAEQGYTVIDTRDLPSNDSVDVKFESKSALDKCTENITHVAPYLKPTFNLAAYANKSETLQELLKLGVNLHKFEKKVTVPPFILGLEFERDIKNHVIFLHELGIEIEQIGETITKNPYILKQSLDDMKARINYLKYKKFTHEMILRILTRNPFWLMFSTNRIDTRLGFFQKEYLLTGNEVRKLATKQPKLITYSLDKIKLNTFLLREEMGFESDEIKRILLNKPKLFVRERDALVKTFDFVHHVMKIPLDVLVKLPEVLSCREFRIKERHLFLEKLDKAQYNPKLPNYISVLSIISGNDAEFCSEVAKSSVQAYNTFLKSL